MAKVTIHIEMDVDVTAFEDKSGLTAEQLASRCWADCEAERNELAAAVRFRALQLMAGDEADG